MFLFLPLFLAGCGEKEPTPQPPSTEDPEEMVLEGTTDQQAYLACVRAGHEIKIVHDAAKNGRVIYCMFEDGSRCPARQFLNEECEPGEDFSGTEALAFDQSIDGLADGPRNCPTDVIPVCGEDGRSYANSCFAQLNHVAVAAQGACKGIEDLSPTKSDSYIVRKTPAKSNTQPSADTTEKPTQASVPSGAVTSVESTRGAQWLDLPISLLDQSDRIEYATMEECTLGRETVFVHTEGKTQDFAVLYDEGGSVICYPKNDIDDTCPKGFDFDRRSCSIVWKKGP